MTEVFEPPHLKWLQNRPVSIVILGFVDNASDSFAKKFLIGD